MSVGAVTPSSGTLQRTVNEGRQESCRPCDGEGCRYLIPWCQAVTPGQQAQVLNLLAHLAQGPMFDKDTRMLQGGPVLWIRQLLATKSTPLQVPHLKHTLKGTSHFLANSAL